MSERGVERVRTRYATIITEGFDKFASYAELKSAFPKKVGKRAVLDHVALGVSFLVKTEANKVAFDAYKEELVRFKVASSFADFSVDVKNVSSRWIEELGAYFCKSAVTVSGFDSIFRDLEDVIKKLNLLLRAALLLESADERVRLLHTKELNAHEAIARKQTQIERLEREVSPDLRALNSVRESIRAHEKKILEYVEKSVKMSQCVYRLEKAIADVDDQGLESCVEELTLILNENFQQFDVEQTLKDRFANYSEQLEYCLAPLGGVDTRDTIVDMEDVKSGENRAINTEVTTRSARTRKNVLAAVAASLVLGTGGAYLAVDNLARRDVELAEKAGVSNAEVEKPALNDREMVRAKAEMRGFVHAMQNKGLIDRDVNLDWINHVKNVVQLEQNVFVLMGDNVVDYKMDGESVSLKPSDEIASGLSALYGPTVRVDTDVVFIDEAQKNFAAVPSNYGEFCRMLNDDNFNLVLRIDHQFPDGKEGVLYSVPTDSYCRSDFNGK